MIQTSTCGPDLNAMNQAYTKSTHGYAVTGVAAVSCHHAFVHPKGVVDLQKGERYSVLCLILFPHSLTNVFRYCNIDYTVALTLADDINAGIMDVVLTYDIGCQWNKNLSRCLSSSPLMPSVDIDSLNSFRVTVPKFHIIGHGAQCQAEFNLVYMDGIGMTHGEGSETIWSHSTSLVTWSRENGPSAHHLILDDHWAGWNWRKCVGLRKPSNLILYTTQLTSTKAPN